MSWNRVSLEAVARFLDFTGGRTDDQWVEVSRRQLDGATALYNRLCDRRVAWLADEVGMGKTYVALGVIALVRHLNPDARVLILVPSSRLQPKWRTEISTFTRDVVRVVDHRARTLQGTPGRPFHEPRSLRELGALVSTDPDAGLLAPLSSFSFGLGAEPADWERAWRRLQAVDATLPDPPGELLSSQRKMDFKRHYAAALNMVLPYFDLVVVDESHNLKHGLCGPSSRNQTLAVALGGSRDGLVAPLAGLVSPKVGRLLCLSATPVETDYDQLVRQAELFGLRGVEGFDLLDDREASGRAEVAKRFVIRRLNRLAIGGRGLTKNLYRREWRWGGVDRHDEALRVTSHLDRLVLALVQKRVTEVLHRTGSRSSDGTFLPSFQMGMLSSFESFSETVHGRVTVSADPDEEEVGGHFDGADQTSDPSERFGVDTATVDALCTSFRERFGRSLPHPKMDAVARGVDGWMARGEKSLVFVRRIRTVEELAGKIARAYDERLFEWLLAEVPASVKPELEEDIERYRENHRRRRGGPLATSGADDDDKGGTDTFFAWYFRGEGTDPDRVGARFRRRRLQANSSRWSTLFHDNPVRRLVGPGSLDDWIHARREPLESLARLYFPHDPGPWQHRYEAWQAAALELLADDPQVGAEASWLRHALYPKRQARPVSGEIGDPHVLLAEQTLFTELAEHPIGASVWPQRERHDREAWRDREVRRELLASAIRLGHPTIDLWLSAVQLTGTLEGVTGNDVSPVELARVFLTRLDAAAGEEGPVGWTRRELVELGAHHDLILSLNFPDVSQRTLAELPRTFQAVLSRQAPVLGMHGSSKSEQAIKQFRMPGYPFAIVCTDILQEGVDLHTFCARVLHYGIAHTSSASEQRTGRVDRINSLVQRRLSDELDRERMLQVHYPHLLDTVEPLQVRVLYERMDRFVRLLHEGLGGAAREESRVLLDQAIGNDVQYPEPPKEELRSRFEVEPGDLVGDDFDPSGEVVPWTGADLRSWLARLEQQVKLDIEPTRVDAAFLGEAWLREAELVRETGGARRQPFRVSLESRRDGRGVRLRVLSPIGSVDLSDGRTAGKVLDLQQDYRGVLVDTEQGTLAVRQDVPLEPGCEPVVRLRLALRYALMTADALEQELVGAHVDSTLAEHRDLLDAEAHDDAR